MKSLESRSISHANESQNERNQETLGEYERMDDVEAERIIKEKINLSKSKEGFQDYDEYLPKDNTAFNQNSRLMRDRMIYDMARLTLELKDRLPKYDIILSDDASGRIPTWFMRKMAIEAKKNQGDDEGIGTYYVASGRHSNMEIFEGIRKFLLDKGASNKKILLMTEYVSTGKSIEKLCSILENLGCDFDIASVSIDPEYGYYDSQRNIIYGGENDGGLVFYDHEGKGVKKSPRTNSNIHSSKISGEQDKINIARQAMDILAEKLSPLLE